MLVNYTYTFNIAMWKTVYGNKALKLILEQNFAVVRTTMILKPKFGAYGKHSL